jgi:carbohydrate diacid regulator
MKLTPDIATQVLSRARQLLDRRVVVTDDRGLVLADADWSGQIIVDALRAAQEGKVVRASLENHQIVWCPFVHDQQTAGVFGIIEEEIHVTPEAISLLQGLAEVITQQHFLLQHIQPTDTMRAGFMKEVLSGHQSNPSEIYRQADILQLNLRSSQAIILFEVTGFEESVSQKNSILSADERQLAIDHEAARVNLRVQEAFNNHMGNINCYLGKDIFVLSKGIGGDGLNIRNTMRFLIEKAQYIHEVLQKLYPSLVISGGVGQYYPDLGGLRKSYQEARLSLLVGTKVWGAGRVYHIKQVGMFVTLANVAQERKAELAHQILFPLFRDEQLYKTVQTFLQSGLNLTEAATKLHVHRNTLIYRLDKTKKVIGLDPRVFDDALQIKLGLMFYQEA